MNESLKLSAKLRQADAQFIVGIGASAGGLEALQALLTALPVKLGFPYVIIQHLSPDYKSLLSEILSKSTSMPVVPAEDGVHPEPDHVYVIPPRKSLTLEDGALRLTDQTPGELHLPVDTFFKSIAEEAGSRAIAIILSGTGSDGTDGIKAVKENDGLIIAQSPESCKFDGMVKSAIRTGLVDITAPIHGIVTELEHISFIAQKNLLMNRMTESEVDANLMERIYTILRQVSNVNFTHYKRATILRRVERRMVLRHIDNLPDYVDLLFHDPEEAKTLSKEVLIGVTSFFREPDFFEALCEKAIKPIILRTPPSEAIRVWVAGCSTGEEAYSIAILFCEAMDELNLKREVKIFATDLDAEAVVMAGRGVFSHGISSSVSTPRLSRYFTRKGNNYVVSREIRRMLIFSPHNVIQDPPFGRLDLISCRNMMIYFQPVLQKDLFGIFHAALKDEGFLFLGKSEAVGTYTEAFPVVDAYAKIFTHRKDVKIIGAKSIPFLQASIDDYRDPMDSRGDTPSSAQGASESDRQLAVNTALLERFMPACLVVDEKNELVYIYGESKNYIAFPVGRVTRSLFDVITDSLRIPVSTALKEARETEKTVQYSDVSFVGEKKNGVVSVTAMPISRSKSGPDSLYAIVFTEMHDRGEMIEAVHYDIDVMAGRRITDLEQELSQAQSKLSSSMSEQESVNEELQASNEELLTANEELQSSNEELQSVNEELYTVNTEYQVKLSELADTNDDITNFLATTLIGIVLVDGKLCVRRYTNYFATEFGMKEQDIGRSIEFLSYYFPTLDFVEICTQVIETLTVDEREVISGRGKAFFMRVSPFRTMENKILGCVVSMMDVSEQKAERERLMRAESELRAAQQASMEKSDFLSRMSHEIRTPMNAIVGLSEIIQSQLDDKEALNKTSRQLAETVKYMTAIVSDILEMSKIERSQLELLLEPFSMTDVLRKVESMIAPRVEESDLHFSLEVIGELEKLYMGDATRIQQVLMNLLTNAVKYTPAGGEVKMTVEEASRDGDVASLRFVVSDTGIGISEEFMREMFKPFTRLNKDASASSSMGLGLSIADSFVRAMDGEISAASKEGEGSVFTVVIRLGLVDLKDDQTLADGSLLTEDQSHDLTGINVLIAEDNAMNRMILVSLLENAGAVVTAVNDGDAAVKTYLSAPERAFDCVLMDMRMPRLDGVEAALLIRKSTREDAKTIPIIAVSANAFTDDVATAYRAGVNEYITKPIDTRKLFGLIRKTKEKTE